MFLRALWATLHASGRVTVRPAAIHPLAWRPSRRKGSQEENFYLSTLFRQCGASILFYYDFEGTVCLLCIKPKNKNTTRAGVKGNVGLCGILSECGALDASV